MHIQYKTRLFDLVDKAVPGPSRTTRRAHTERQQFLVGPTASTSTIPPPIAPKSKIKAKTTTAIWERLGTARDKGKGKQKDVGTTKGSITAEHVEESVALVEDEVKAPAEESISVVFARRHIPRKGKIMEVSVPSVARDRKKESREKLTPNNGHIAESISAPARRSGRLKGPADETNPSVEAVMTRARCGSQASFSKRGHKIYTKDNYPGKSCSVKEKS